jgi:hypothetical protein
MRVIFWKFIARSFTGAIGNRASHNYTIAGSSIHEIRSKDIHCTKYCSDCSRIHASMDASYASVCIIG